jgi:hypothetical protein
MAETHKKINAPPPIAGPKRQEPPDTSPRPHKLILINAAATGMVFFNNLLRFPC